MVDDIAWKLGTSAASVENELFKLAGPGATDARLERVGDHARKWLHALTSKPQTPPLGPMKTLPCAVPFIFDFKLSSDGGHTEVTVTLNGNPVWSEWVWHGEGRQPGPQVRDRAIEVFAARLRQVLEGD